MKKLDVTKLKKEQAKILRSKGMGYKKIAAVTGLTKDVVRNAIKDVTPGPEDRTLGDRMENGEACLYCGDDLPRQSGSGRHRRYCSDGCRRAYWQIHRAEGKQLSTYTHICTYCGKAFEVYGRVKRKYCSRDCYMQHRNGDHTNPVDPRWNDEQTILIDPRRNTAADQAALINSGKNADQDPSTNVIAV